MKYFLIIFLVLFILAASGGETASAQNGRRLSSTPKAFQVFYTKFRKAVIARHKVTVASLTRFPFRYGYDAGDEGTYSRAQFLKNFKNVFGDDIAIFRLTNPAFHSEGAKFDLVDESDASHYIFEKKGTTYKFTGYFAEP